MPTAYQKITAQVLERIKPKDKALLKQVKEFLASVNDSLKAEGLKAKAVVAGSIAKDTYLAGDHDCDVFVKFGKEHKDGDLSKLLLKALKKFKPELVHGSRDYYSIKNGMNYEIVPVLDIKKAADAVNVTDMSPLHVEWVKKHPGFNDEIRLAKQFCKAARIYGAESYIKGFSGHVLDILTIHYGGFMKLLKASQKWKDKEVIDPEKHYKKDALAQLNRSKTDSPIIVIDPVLPSRNAAAALSYEKLEIFKKAAADFIKKPLPEAFMIKEKTLSDIQNEAGKDKLILLEVQALPGKEDVVGAKLLKAFQQIRNQLMFYDFELKKADWNWDKDAKALFWYVVDSSELIPLKKWTGPPIAENERVKNFKEKHPKTFTENGRICTYVKRRYVRAEDLVSDALKDPLLRERVKSIKQKT
ncbi:CCA tRNA nucleotidyltransferase [Candidatus Woesearchaeota archaeon]|nr:CCA tRNA nucleotidyltransferase [Candidatus Woesearchaeota archaeon]